MVQLQQTQSEVDGVAVQLVAHRVHVKVIAVGFVLHNVVRHVWQGGCVRVLHDAHKGLLLCRSVVGIVVFVFLGGGCSHTHAFHGAKKHMCFSFFGVCDSITHKKNIKIN